MSHYLLFELSDQLCTFMFSVDNLKEGERCHLECRLEPINDPNLKVEWFVNGVEIKTGEFMNSEKQAVNMNILLCHSCFLTGTVQALYRVEYW